MAPDHAEPTAPAAPPPAHYAVEGAIWLSVGGESFGGQARIGLLQAIASQGSITRAAQQVGISYKTAWDAIDTMNQLAGHALVTRSTGGRGGGSTRLTAHGQQLVERFAQVDAAHQRFLRLLNGGSLDLSQAFSELQTLNLRTSASNQFVGTVSAVRLGAVNDEVELALDSGARLVAVVTHGSALALGLRTGQTAYALLQAASVLLAAGLEGARVSARNQWAGVVQQVRPGAVNAEVLLQLDQGGTLTAAVPQASLDELPCRPGSRLTALFKASDVVLATAA
ncbi:MAG: TOBE domain-containing protein [Rubrivivax sp.]|jgi:molybdate transport system regulatory protein